MDDLISRQAAIDALDKQIKQCCKALGSLCLSDVDKHAVEVKMASLRAYRGMLKNLPTAQPEPKWIPCKNDLPDIGMTVLFCDIDGDEFIGHRALYWWWSVDEKVKNVIAWMPLPEPYKPNKKQSGKEGT